MTFWNSTRSSGISQCGLPKLWFAIYLLRLPNNTSVTKQPHLTATQSPLLGCMDHRVSMTCAMKLICPCGSSQSREAPTTVACIYSLLLNKNLVFLYFHPGNIFSISILEIFSLHPSWVHIIDISIFSICSQCPCYLNYRAADSVSQDSGQVIQVKVQIMNSICSWNAS